jgi:PhzF family phenazine biosynthesis protein
MLFWVVDTFTHNLFEGNPAAVCWTERALHPDVFQKIAREFNVHETVFLSPLQNQHFQANIYTPTSNESFCGHSLLAAAHVLWEELKPEGLDPAVIYLETKLGIFMVSAHGNSITVHTTAKMAEPAAVPDRLVNALGSPPIAVSRYEQTYVVEMFNPKQVVKLKPDIAKIEKIACRGVVVTAEGGNDVEYDFISRFFAPNEGFKEDSVTLWNHCFLAPYWKMRLKKNTFKALQCAVRGGFLDIECVDEHVNISGECVVSSSGKVRGLSNWLFHSDLFGSL